MAHVRQKVGLRLHAGLCQSARVEIFFDNFLFLGLVFLQMLHGLVKGFHGAADFIKAGGRDAMLPAALFLCDQTVVQMARAAGDAVPDEEKNEQSGHQPEEACRGEQGRELLAGQQMLVAKEGLLHVHDPHHFSIAQ